MPKTLVLTHFVWCFKKNTVGLCFNRWALLDFHEEASRGCSSKKPRRLSSWYSDAAPNAAPSHTHPHQCNIRLVRCPTEVQQTSACTVVDKFQHLPVSGIPLWRTHDRLLLVVGGLQKQQAMGQNPVPPVNIPIPTQIAPGMDGAATPKWDPKTVLTHSQQAAKHHTFWSVRMLGALASYLP